MSAKDLRFYLFNIYIFLNLKINKAVKKSLISLVINVSLSKKKKKFYKLCKNCYCDNWIIKIIEDYCITVFNRI